MSRPREDRGERRDAIALAAAEVIADRGLERATMRDIAAALGVTTGVLTHYFPSKDALLRHTKTRVLLSFFGGAVGSPAWRREHSRRMQRWYTLYHDVVASLRDTGELAPDADPMEIGRAIVLFVEGMAINLVMTTPKTSNLVQREFARAQVRRLVGSTESRSPSIASTDTGDTSARRVESM
jgi:AcrR family transcriptional regulator